MSSSISCLKDIFYKVRESHIKPGSYRLQNLLNSNYFNALSFAPVILVGGTNGKGSTCAFLESIFRNSGLKTGLYTSPHLVSVSERIRIAGKPIFEKEILDTIHKLDTNKIFPLHDFTFFELMTAAAFMLFQEKKVDIILCEVGLGGRYDSTNVINPTISVLTGVSLDHTHILGKKVAQIAADKSYIARRNKPFVVNAGLSVQALTGVSKTVKLIGCNMILTSQKLNPFLEEIFLENQIHKSKINLRTALTVLDCILSGDFDFKSVLTSFNIRKGIQQTFWPGRFDVRTIQNRTVIFDCAHNPGGIKFFLQQYVNSVFANRKFDLVFASMQDKDWKKNLQSLVPFSQSIEIVPFANERAQNSCSIFAYLKKHFPESKVQLGTQLNDSVHKVLKCTSTNPVLVIGSIAFVGAVFESLHIDVFPT